MTQKSKTLRTPTDLTRIYGPLHPAVGWLPGLRRMDDGEYRAGCLPLLSKPPGGVVLHCGSTAGDLARYCEDEPDGRAVSYHFVIDRGRKQIIQMVPLTHRAWHAGSWNDWIGIAFRGPSSLDPRPAWERAALRYLLSLVVMARPSVQLVARHSEQKRSKTDPGPGVKDAWIEGLGLKWGVPS